jgi:hypothetical protein
MTFFKNLGARMLHYDSHQYYRDEGPLPDLRGRDVVHNTALIVGAGLALCLWDRVVTPGYFLLVYAFDAAAHALSPARQVEYRGPFPAVVSPYAPYFTGVVFGLVAYLAFRICRSIARFFSAWGNV